MKILYIVILLFSNSLIYSQENEVTKKSVKKAFKKSIRNKDYWSWDEWSGYWETNNIDSTYYKSDTIVLINRIGLNSINCNYITWKFYKKNAFHLQEINSCKEPPSARVSNTNDFYTITIAEKEKILYLKTNNLNTETIYKVISFEALSDKRTLKLQKLSHKTINR